MVAAKWKCVLPIALLATFAAAVLGFDCYAENVRGPKTAGVDPVPRMSVGMNLGMLNYWSQEFPFIDIIDGASIKVVDGQNEWQDAKGLISIAPGGYPMNVPIGTKLVVIIKSGGGDRLPTGSYDCTISPGWDVQASAVARMRSRRGGFVLEVMSAPAKGGLYFKLTPRGRQASLTDFSCRSVGERAKDIFNSAFLTDTRPFNVIRFMDWMKANKKHRMNWRERTTPESFSQAAIEGASVEYMVALANQVNADPWFTLPLQADEEYYRSFATYVRDNLRRDRKAYVEVSNEVWNRIFLQSKIAIAEGKRLYPEATDSEANDYFYADRIRAVMQIWMKVFKGHEARIIRVYATQVGSRQHPRVALSHKDTASFVDSMAVAPYFGPDKGKPDRGADATEYLLTHGNEFVDAAIRRALVSKEVATQFGLPLISYEGGPDYVSFNPRLKEAFQRAEHDPRIYNIYKTFLRRWRDEVGGLYVAFDSVNQRFGHKLYTGQPLEQAPKMRALIDFIHENGMGKDNAR